jgi:hypothetical protein
MERKARMLGRVNKASREKRVSRASKVNKEKRGNKESNDSNRESRAKQVVRATTVRVLGQRVMEREILARSRSPKGNRVPAKPERDNKAKVSRRVAVRAKRTTQEVASRKGSRDRQVVLTKVRVKNVVIQGMNPAKVAHARG